MHLLFIAVAMSKAKVDQERADHQWERDWTNDIDYRQRVRVRARVREREKDKTPIQDAQNQETLDLTTPRKGDP